MIAEGAFYDLDAPVQRLGAMHVPIPFSPPLEDVTVPTTEMFELRRSLCNKYDCGRGQDLDGLDRSELVR